MSGRRSNGTTRALSRAWHDWTEIVRLFAESRSAREQLAEPTYRQLHQELTSRLNELSAAAGGDPTQSETCERCLAIVRPWITLSSLRQADARILQQLLMQCESSQRDLPVAGETIPAAVTTLELPTREFGDRRLELSSSSGPPWMAIGIFALLFVIMFGVVLAADLFSPSDNAAWDFSAVIGTIRQSLHDKEGDSKFWILAGTATVVMATTAWIVFRPPRSY